MRMRTLADAGGALGGRSAKTARRILEEAGVPLYRVGASLMVQQDDLDDYLESRRVEPRETGLRSLVHAAVERARARRAS